MNQTLVDAIVKLTGKTEEEVQEKLASVPIDDLYKLMDLVRQGDKASIVDFIDPIEEAKNNPYQTVKTMADNKKITGIVPKPRDPMAKALALPQYQPKTTPSKKGQLDKALRKHKGRDVQESLNVDTDAELVEESVMGMTQMDSMLPRLLTLAGCPPMDDQETNQIEIVQPQDQSTAWAPAAMDNLDAEWDELETELDPTNAPVTVTELPPAPVNPGTANIQMIRDSFNSIRTNLPDIKVSEFAELRAMMADLMSQIDRMGNHISGK
jgi:DNA polymerase III gamma/tau subunit